MKIKVAQIFLAMTLWVALLAGLLFALNFGRISPIEGAMFIDSVSLCDTSECNQTTALPYHSDRETIDETMNANVVASVTFDTVPSAVQAMYLPKFADTLAVTLNGQTLYAPPEHLRMWNTPLVISIPPSMLREGDNRFEIALSGPAPEGLQLWPFHVGPEVLLRPHLRTRDMLGQGIGRFSMGLMGVLAAALMLIWLSRREDMHYFWLTASCLSALIVLTHYAFGVTLGSYKIWTILWAFSPPIYIIAILKFLRHLLGIPALRLEAAHLCLIVVFAVAALILPGGYTYLVALFLNVMSAPSAIAVLVILWMSRSVLTTVDFSVFFICISLAVSLGLYALILHGLPNSPRSLPMFQVMPMVMSFACVYLILSKFLQSHDQYEKLTASLNQTLEERTHELEQSFTRLAQIEKREVIAEERNRIMLDLHDGLGGQLVNTLAYIKRSGSGDEQVILALEEALRDLAMMLDSVESQESLVTLLGMLRTRLEGLMADHGLTFDWQIGDEPKAPITGPSPNLNLARIVQEAITNVIKHANADVIRVETDAQTISIIDNGRGFDPQSTRANGQGHGIYNMTRRAEALGAVLQITSSDEGTTIALTFPTATDAPG